MREAAQPKASRRAAIGRDTPQSDRSDVSEITNLDAHCSLSLGVSPRLLSRPALTRNAALEKQMQTRVFRATVAAMLVLFLTLLFDYCRYEIEHHPHFDFTRVIYLSIQGVVISINFLAMLKFVESFNRRA